MKVNLYRIDDVLIRMGWVIGVLAVLLAFGVFDNARRDWSFGLIPVALIVPSLVLLGSGLLLRRREERTRELGELMQRHRSVPLADARAMTGFSLRGLREAVQVLNRKTAAGLTLDEAKGRITHMSVTADTRFSHAQQCSSCGASVTVDVTPSSTAEDLNCPYCQGALDTKALSMAQRFVHAPQSFAAMPQAAPAAPPRVEAHKPFRLGWFVFLFFVCWPAALIYALIKARNAPLAGGGWQDGTR